MSQMTKNELYNWLTHNYDDKLQRHMVIEDIYNKIRNYIDNYGLEMKISEDEFYQKLLQFIVLQTKM